MSFESLGLRTELLQAIAKKGYTSPSPVQQQAIPPILEGHDIIAGAQTGTGKTAGFTLPLLQRLMSSTEQQQHHPIRALVLTPTRELATQVAGNIHVYGKYLPLRSMVVFGGVKIDRQIEKLRRDNDILIATPGRLLDLARQKAIDLSQVEILVLDEADRMLDMGFIRDIRKILAYLPKQRQTLLFSATFSDGIKKLSNEFLKSPIRVNVAPSNAVAESVDQIVHPVDKHRKHELLAHLIDKNNWQQVLVFTRTKTSADKLTKQLMSENISTAAIHSGRSQASRNKALVNFKSGKVRVLIATDVAARGLDIHQLPQVVNFELPNAAEDYIHRIGRTGRANLEGKAISFVCIDEQKLLKDIEQLTKCDIPQITLDDYAPDPSIKARAINWNSRKKSPSLKKSASRAKQSPWDR